MHKSAQARTQRRLLGLDLGLRTCAEGASCDNRSMARALNRLNPKSITAVKNPLAPGMHADGGGLYLKVDATGADGSPGAKRFTFIFQWGGKRREMGLGSIHDVTLERARELAATARGQVEAGIDPRAARDAAKVERTAVAEAVTFGTYALQVLEFKKADWFGRKTEARWLNTINNHCASILNVPVADIDTAMVLGVFRPIWNKIPEGAEKSRATVETILDSAKALGLRSGDNPARWEGHLKELLSKRKKLTKGSHAAAAAAGIGELMAQVREREGIGAAALELLILTGARTTEVREAPWGEFDLDAALWSIPRTRVKERGALERAQVSHKRIPLSAPAVALLRRLSDEGGAKPDAYVFPGPVAGKPLGENGMTSMLKRIGADNITVHGFRSTFRDWAGAQRIVLTHGRKVPAYSFEACEISLGHTVGNSTTAAYFRGDLLAERRDLMSDWALVCAGEEPTYSGAPSEMSQLLAFLAQEPQFAARWAAFQAGGGVAAAA